MTNLTRRHHHADPYLQQQVAAHAFALSSGRSVAAADAIWRMASHLEIIEPGQQILSAANLDDLKQQLADRGYSLVGVPSHGR